MRTFVGCALALALAFSTSVAQEKGKIDGKLLIGKWTPKEDKKGGAGMTLEFMKDGKLAIAIEGGGKSEKVDGTYKLDGDKLVVSLTYEGAKKEETLTVKKLTDAELETADSKGKTDSFTKVKDEKKK